MKIKGLRHDSCEHIRRQLTEPTYNEFPQKGNRSFISQIYNHILKK